MHPAVAPPSIMTPGLMTSNLMVTGGAGGRWAPDPAAAAALSSHPWMPRPGAPPVWLPGSPYGTPPPDP